MSGGIFVIIRTGHVFVDFGTVNPRIGRAVHAADIDIGTDTGHLTQTCIDTVHIDFVIVFRQHANTDNIVRSRFVAIGLNIGTIADFGKRIFGYRAHTDRSAAANTLCTQSNHPAVKINRAVGKAFQ